ncbi:MAG: ArnT family glycosyltransferase [Promethearchaeota archaeon]
MFTVSNLKDYFQNQFDRIVTSNQYQIRLFGYLTVFTIYLITHLVYFVEYPAFSGDEMFYVSKAVVWRETGNPSIFDWYYFENKPEFTNPSTLSLIYIFFAIFFGLSPLLIRSIMLTIGVINLLIVFLVGREIGGTENPWYGYLIGILSGLFLALDWELIFYARTGYLDNPMNLCLTISLFFYLKYLRTDDLNYTWLAGIAAGVGLWFKLSAVYFLIGLGVFSVFTRKIDAALRVQVMMTLFIGLYVVWGMSIDPIQFVNGNYLHISGEYKGHPPTVYAQLILGKRFGFFEGFHVIFERLFSGNIDPIRTLILFSFLIPILYLRKRKNSFYEKSFLVLCMFLGTVILFILTKIIDHYVTGFASFYALLFAIGLLIASRGVKCLQNKLLELTSSSINPEFFKRSFQIFILGIFLFMIIIKFHFYNPLIFPLENQDALDVIAYVQQEIPKGETFIAQAEVGPWLNASGYTVYTIAYINASPSDSMVREYISHKVMPSYVILHKDYQYIVQDLDYSVVYSTPTFKIWAKDKINL